MGSPLGAAKYNSLLQGAASLDRLGTTGLSVPLVVRIPQCGNHCSRNLACFNYLVNV